MNKMEIKELCSNKIIEEAYTQFKKEIRIYKIVDMYLEAHFVKPFDLLFIKYINSNNRIKTFEYIKKY